MSRKSSISAASEFFALGATATARSRLLLLGELVRRNRNRDLARFGIKPGREHEHGAVGQAAHNADQGEKAEQARHGLSFGRELSQNNGKTRTRAKGTGPGGWA